MKDERLEPAIPAQGFISYDARVAADTDVSVSSYASTVSSVPIESLEVHDQTSAARVSAPMPAQRGLFLGRKASIISAALTVLIVGITSASVVLLNRNKDSESANRLNLGLQDVALKDQAGVSLPAELQGAENSLLINGDLVTKGQLKVANGAYLTVLRPANLTSNQNLVLPNASGTFCVDSNNCGYATTAQLRDLQGRLGQIVIPDVPAATRVNGLSGSVSIQGTTNQVSVTTANGVIALAGPQDLAPISSPTFAGMLLNGNFSLSGTLTLPLNCTGQLNGGALTTNASGQVVCSGDDGGSGGGVGTPGGTAGRLAMFTAASTIADSIITEALGAITVGGNTSVSGSLAASSLTLAAALSVANGGTGATTFTTNGVLVGNGVGAVTATTAPTAGQVLLGNGSNVPQFTTVSGDVVITGAGVTSIQANSVALGVDTAGDYVANLGALTGLTTSGNSGEGSTPTLSVIYGSTANTAVQGNNSITVSAGTNLSGGGSITLGSGGTVTLNVSNSPTFSGNVIVQGGTVTIGSTSQIGSTALHDGNGQIGTLTTTDLSVGRTYTFPDATGTVCLSSGNCVGGTGGAPNAATFITLSNDATLTDERAITAGNNIGFTDGGANSSLTVGTVNNPNFTTSVTTPLLQSSGALSITPSGALTVGATGQTALLQGSTTTITSNGAGNDIVLNSADQIRLAGFDCTAFSNGGVLTTDASGNISCANDDGGAGGAITGTGTANRLTMFTGSQSVADSWLLQNGSTLELDNTRNLSLLGGNFSVTGAGTFSGLLTANGSLTIESGDTFTMNGDAFTDLTGTGLVISSGSLQTSLGTSVDLAAEVTGLLPVVNGGTGVDGSSAANGTLLIGNASGYTLATLTQGAGMTITNGSGTISIASAFGASVDLGIDTTGDYQLGTTGGNGIAVSGTQGAGWTAGLALGNLTANWNQAGAFDIVLANASSELQVMESSGGTYYGTIDVGDLTANRTYTFPDASGTICLSTGNCAGSGGGITGSGTTDAIAKFTGSGTIGDSSISDNGSVVTILSSVNLVVQGGTSTLGTSSQAGTLVLSDGSSNALTIVTDAFSANRTYTLPDVGGSANFCLSTGNCLGSGGGGAPNTAAYLVASLTGDLTSERALAAGSNIDVIDSGANANFTVATVMNPSFTTSVTTPLLQSSGGLAITSAAGQTVVVDAGTTIELQDNTNVTGNLDASGNLNVGGSNAFQVNSSGAIAAATGITSSGTITFSGLDCTTFTNGGKVTTNGSGVLQCANDSGTPANTVTGTGTSGTVALFNGASTITDSIVTQSGTTINIAGDLTLNTELAVGQGGTGRTSFTSNGVVYGNGTSALNVTAAGTTGQVLVANGSGVPTFVSFSGDVAVSAAGATAIQADSVALGVDTTGNYIATLGSLTGLTTSGNTGEGSTPTLSVIYGSTANTAVEGNTTITCPSGTGNLTGGGTSITLGAGGTCANLNTVNNPSFTTSVTTPLLQSSAALAIQTGGGTNNITLGSSDTTGTLLVLDIKTDASDPTGVNGGMYYNGNAGKFRCYEGSAWKDCIPVVSTVTLQTAYTASTNPEIVLDATRGALTVRDNATPIAANLFEIQNNGGGTTYMAVTTTGTTVGGTLTVSGAATFNSGLTVAAGQNITLDTGSGALNFDTDAEVYIRESGSIDTDVMELFARAGYAYFTNTGQDVFGISQNGMTTAKANVDAFGGLQVVQANDNPVLTVSTSGTEGEVRVGYSADTDPTLFILDNDTDQTSDPTGIEGGMYYNNGLNKFRCYQNTSWADCITATPTLQQAYNASTSPEIVLDATRGALTVRDSSTPIGANLLEVQNNAGSTSYLAVNVSALTLGTNIDLIMQGASAYISNPQAQTNSEAFGLNAAAAGPNSLAVGAGASGHSSGGSTAIGSSASAGINGTAVGYATNIQGNGVGIGYGASANSGSIAIGRDAVASSTSSIAIGRDATTTASNQLVIGSEPAGQYFNHVVIGSGVVSATPTGFTLQGTSGSGSNITGASVNIAAGQGTGTGVGGSINLQVSAPGSSGSSLNALATVATFSGTNGSANFTNSVNSATAFRIQSASAAETLLNVDTTARSGSGGNLIKIGNSTGTDTALTLLQLDAATAAPTSNLSALSGSLFYNSTTNKVSIIENGVVKVVCNETDAGCGNGGSTDLAKNQVATETSTSNFVGTMYSFTQSNTGAAGVLSMSNAGTNSTLSVTSTANPSGTNALMYGQLTNTSATGNLINLRSGSSGSETSRLTVTGQGATTVNVVNGSNGTSGGNGANLLTVSGANGGNGSAGVGGTGGAISLSSGEGGDSNDGSAAGGVGGSISLQAGHGGDNTNIAGSGVGANGGDLSFTAGNGGISANGNGDGLGGNILLRPGTGSSVATSGNVVIGTSDTAGALLVLDTKTNAGDPTGITGAMYYNSNIGVMRCYLDGRWGHCNEGSRMSFGYNVQEEFIGAAPGSNEGQGWTCGSGTVGMGTTHSWNCYGSGSDSTLAAVATDSFQRPGQLQLTTGTGSTNSIITYLGGGNGSKPFVVGGGEVFETALNIPTLGTSVERYIVRIGLCDATEGSNIDCTNGVYFEYDSATSANWRYATAGASTRTKTSSSKAVATGWTNLKWVATSSTSVTFYAKSPGDSAYVSLGTTTTNIPNTTGNATRLMLGLYKTGGSGGTAPRTVTLDYIDYYNDLITRR